MSYNRYVGRHCNFCGHRQGLKVDGTFQKHSVGPKDKTVCEGSGKLPSDRPEQIKTNSINVSMKDTKIFMPFRIPGFGRGG